MAINIICYYYQNSLVLSPIGVTFVNSASENGGNPCQKLRVILLPRKVWHCWLFNEVEVFKTTVLFQKFFLKFQYFCYSRLVVNLEVFRYTHFFHAILCKKTHKNMRCDGKQWNCSIPVNSTRFFWWISDWFWRIPGGFWSFHVL